MTTNDTLRDRLRQRLAAFADVQDDTQLEVSADEARLLLAALPGLHSHKTNADRASKRIVTLVQGVGAEGGPSPDRVLMALVGLLVVEVARLSDAINGVESTLDRVEGVARDISLHGIGQAK